MMDSIKHSMQKQFVSELMKTSGKIKQDAEELKEMETVEKMKSKLKTKYVQAGRSIKM
jgi:hypothetical protein